MLSLSYLTMTASLESRWGAAAAQATRTARAEICGTGEVGRGRRVCSYQFHCGILYLVTTIATEDEMKVLAFI